MQTKSTFYNLLIGLNLLLVLGAFNYSVYTKEKTLAEGTLVLLELAPVDPRSLMQGDYMVLEYAISQDIQEQDVPSRGYVVLQLDEKDVGTLVRLQPNPEPLAPGEHLLKYFHNGRTINLGAESFFFQEGKGDLYAMAEYGALRVDSRGNSILVGLYDEELKRMEDDVMEK